MKEFFASFGYYILVWLLLGLTGVYPVRALPSTAKEWCGVLLLAAIIQLSWERIYKGLPRKK